MNSNLKLTITNSYDIKISNNDYTTNNLCNRKEKFYLSYFKLSTVVLCLIIKNKTSCVKKMAYLMHLLSSLLTKQRCNL